MAIVGVLVLGALPAMASAWEVKLVAHDRQNADFFGEAVAISGDTVVVGARLQNAGGFDRGAAYIFVRSGGGWAQQAKLTAADATNSDHFGAAVAISGDTVVIGAPLDDDAGTSSGAAYTFTRADGTWTQTAKLTAPDGAPGDEFGSAVALSEDTALVGARWDDDGGRDAGSAYVFRNVDESWEQEAKLVADGGRTGDRFGHSLALSGDTALVSAYADDDRALDAGAVYFFSRDAGGWTQAAKVTAPDGAASDFFGFAVSLSHDHALIGAFADDDSARDAGSAYVLRRVDGAWDHEAKLRPADPAEGSVFGRAAAIDGGAALVGAPLDDTLGTNAGAVYVFERHVQGWTQTGKLTAPDGAATDLLGYAVAIDGDTGVVGAPLDDDRGTDAGSVHVFNGLADIVPPDISVEIDPAGNDAGWHNHVPVSVTFTCTDAGSGIASCTAPVAIADEGHHLVVGTAVDQVGNATSLAVDVWVDTSAPDVTIDDLAPVPGVPFPASTITGTATDTLSGVEQVVVTFTNTVTGATETRAAVTQRNTWTVSARGLPPGPTSASVAVTDVAGNAAPEKTLLFVAHP